jgi:hypothetical protein
MLEEIIPGYSLNDLGKRLENEMYFVRFKLSGRMRFSIQVDDSISLLNFQMQIPSRIPRPFRLTSRWSR